MTLVLSIANGPDGVATMTRRLDSGSLSIGRGPRSDWVLPDPDRVLSKQHCVVACAGDGWEVTDTSSNGTFLNHEPEALGNQVSRPLRDGDRLLIGSYEINAAVERDQRATPDNKPFTLSGFGTNNAYKPKSDERLPGDPFAPVENDPLGISIPPAKPPVEFRTTRSDHLPAIEAEYRPPRPSMQLLPEDWDIETPAAGPPGRETPPAADRQAVSTMPDADIRGATASNDTAPEEIISVETMPGEPKSGPITSGQITSGQITPPRNAPAPMMPGPATEAPIGQPVEPAGKPAPGFAAFAAGAGLSGPPPADGDTLLRAIGAAFRAVVAGLRQAMIARTVIKSEFRIDQTMMQASGNNPLKFSANDDDALAGLLGIGRRTDMTPETAISEAMRDIRLHELAMASAMRRATQDLLASLSPAEAAARAGASPLDHLPGQRAARLWRAYEGLLGSVAQALSDDLNGVFGRGFMRAYEQALRDTQGQMPATPTGRTQAQPKTVFPMNSEFKT